MTTITNEAQNYSALISGEVVALEQLLSDPFGEDRETLLTELGLDHLEPTDNGHDIIAVWLNETVLDVSVQIDTRKHYLDGRVVLLRTVGGPRCEVVREYENGTEVEILTWSSGEFGRVVVSASHFAMYFDELIETHHDH
jgi:hypothetical protein